MMPIQIRLAPPAIHQNRLARRAASGLAGDKAEASEGPKPSMDDLFAESASPNLQMLSPPRTARGDPGPPAGLLPGPEALQLAVFPACHRRFDRDRPRVAGFAVSSAPRA